MGWARMNTPLSGVNPEVFYTNLVLNTQSSIKGDPGVIRSRQSSIFSFKSQRGPTYQVSSIYHRYFPSYPISKVQYHFSWEKATRPEGAVGGVLLTGFVFDDEL